MSSTPDSEDRYSSLQVRRRLVAAGVCLAIVLAGWFYAPYVNDGPVACPHRLATGLPCPACGLTRSVCATVHGRPLEAFRENLLGPVVALSAALGAPLLAIEALRRRPIRWMQRVLFSWKVGWTLAITIMLWHAGRIVAIIATGHLLERLSESVPGKLLAHLL